jgi:F-type H+-transporting ATPase subunit a
MAAGGPHISISAEQLYSIGGLNINNSMLTSVIVSVLLILFAVWVRVSLRKTNRPTGIQNFAEWMIESLNNLIHSVTNDRRKTDLFFPLIATFFLFIMANNWFGLLPGVGTIQIKGQGLKPNEVVLKPSTVVAKTASLQVQAAEVAPAHAQEPTATSSSEEHTPETQTAATTEEHAEEGTEHSEFVPLLRAGTADLNMTLALGLISVASIQFFGLKYLKLGYLKKYINFSNPINFFVGILEIILELSKVVSFAFRLFGNIFAGEVLLGVITFLVPIIAPMPFYGLELFVGFIQALVFTMLSLVLFNMATISHDEH